MRVNVLGGLRVVAGGETVDLGSPKQQMVLVVLALGAPRAVLRDRLLELLWPDHDPDKAIVGLQSYVSNLRRALDPVRADDGRPVLVHEHGAYRLDAAVDLAELEASVEAAGAMAISGDTAGASAVARRALLEADSPPTPEFADLPVVVEATVRWRRALARGLELTATHELTVGGASDVAALLEPHLHELPDHERLHVLAATATYQAGRQSDALRIIDRLRRALRDGAGLEPSPEVRDLERAILSHSPIGPASEPPRDVLPPEVRTKSATRSILGRAAELATLDDAVEAASAGAGGVILMTGEPGVGKSAVLEALGPSLSVRCPSNGAAPPFWPLTQITEVDFGAGAAHRGDPFLIAEAVAASVGDRAVVLAIDDLHDADPDTLRTITHLCHSLRTSRCLLVLASRPLGPDADPELVACLAEVARHGRAEIELRPLAPDATANWVIRRLGADGADVAPTVHERSGGNALFARELIELIAADPAALDALRSGDPGRIRRSVPAGVRAVVRQRVGLMPPDAQQLLSLASALGTEVQLDALAQLAAITPERCARSLAPAVADGLITVVAGAMVFSHAIIRDALCAEMTADRLATVNAEFATVLSSTEVGDEHAALIAHHAAAGALAGTGALAADAASRAAALAAERGAHRDATRLWILAATHLDTPATAGEHRQAMLRAARSAAEVDDVETVAGIVTGLLATSIAARDMATATAAADVLNRPSIFPNHAYGTVNADLVALLRVVMERADTGNAATGAAVASALTTELADSPDAAGRSAYSIDAVASARLSGDPQVLARALHARSFALKHQGGVEERLAVSEELRRLATEHDLGDEVPLLADLQAALAEFGLGRFEGIDSRLARCVALAARPVGDAVRSQLTYFRSHVAFVRGRHAEAETLGTDAHQRTLISRPLEAPGIRLAQQLMVAFDLGGVSDDLLVAVASIPETNGYARPLRTYAALALLEHGREADAAAIAPVDVGLPSRPDDYLTLFVDTTTAALAVEVGDVDLAVASIERLAPWRGRWVYAGTAAGSFGLVEHTLARCEALAGDAEAAATDVAAAVAGHRRLGARSWLERSERLRQELEAEGLT